MRMTRATRVRMLVAWGMLGAVALPACGGEDFENEPRPPVQLAVTAVITEQQLEVSPNRFGAGPITLTISNQTPEAHSVTIEGRAGSDSEVLESTGPINPSDAVTIQQDLEPGRYRVTALSEQPGGEDIEPGRIVVGPERPSTSDELDLP